MKACTPLSLVLLLLPSTHLPTSFFTGGRTPRSVSGMAVFLTGTLRTEEREVMMYSATWERWVGGWVGGWRILGEMGVWVDRWIEETKAGWNELWWRAWWVGGWVGGWMGGNLLRARH